MTVCQDLEGHSRGKRIRVPDQPQLLCWEREVIECGEKNSKGNFL